MTMSSTKTESTPVSSTNGSGKGGQRLAAAFQAVSATPALREVTARLQRATEAPGTPAADLAELIENDVAVSIAVMRSANNGGGPRGRVATVVDAVDEVSPAGVRAIAAGLPTYDLLEVQGPWSRLPERFRRHAIAVRHAAENVADLVDVADRDELAVAALLHDIGQLVLLHLHPDYEVILGDRSLTPEDRVRAEQRDLGMDHTIVGGVLARRWGLPTSLASAIERHHSDHAEGMAAAIRLADMIAHQASGEIVSSEALKRAADSCKLSHSKLQQLIFEYPRVSRPRPRREEPCPLSRRELDALRGLADGKVYKEIADEMGLSPSTIRTHLHNVYRKIGAADRAQAVLLARERGWV